MKKVWIYPAVISAALLPLAVVVSCSNSLQNEGNQIYKRIYQESQTRDDVGRADAYINNVYDWQTLLDSTSPNSALHTIPSKFEVFLSDLRYVSPTELELKLNLRPPGANRVLKPQWDGKGDFFTNTIRIRGFRTNEAFAASLATTYQKLATHPLTFNEEGIRRILNYNQNINAHISFGADLAAPDHISQLLVLPADSAAQFELARVVPTNLAEPIERDTQQQLLNFSFKILLKPKGSSDAAVDAPTNLIRQFSISYNVNFYHQLEAATFGLATTTVAEAIRQIEAKGTSQWVWDNRAKLFNRTSQPLLARPDWISDVEIEPLSAAADVNTLALRLKFGPEATDRQSLSTIIIGFAKPAPAVAKRS